MLHMLILSVNKHNQTSGIITCYLKGISLYPCWLGFLPVCFRFCVPHYACVYTHAMYGMQLQGECCVVLHILAASSQI